MVVHFRIQYKGVPDAGLSSAYIYGCAESEMELIVAIERETKKPALGTSLDPYVYIPKDIKAYTDDVLRLGGIYSSGYDESLAVRCPEIWELLPEEEKKAATNIFNLEKKVPITPVVEPPMQAPEPEKPPVERIKEEKHITSPKPKGYEGFKLSLQEKDISVLMLDTKEEADFKRIRFLALGFKTLYFGYKDKFIVLIFNKDFDKNILRLIRDLMKSFLKKKIDVEIGLPEVEGKPEEVPIPDTEEKAIEMIKKSLSYKRKIMPEEIKMVLEYYPTLWDNLLNKCLEYDAEYQIHYALRKDWMRTIRGISIFVRGLTRLIGTKDRKTYVFESRSENPKDKDKMYRVSITVREDFFVMDSDEPDRMNDVVVGISVDGKRQVEKFITKHMVSALILFTMG